jgi:aryl-alcohol dehydrogenase-like predicted oxidoreductase
METRQFGGTGLKVSALGFGGAPMGFLNTDEGQVGKMLNTLLDRGVRVIDTAAMYAGSEELIGRTIGHRREDYVLVTKAPSLGDGEDCWSGPKILASVERSLQRLRTDHLDVVLLHSSGKDVLEKGEALEALLLAKQAGKLRFAGYSGDNEVASFAATLSGISVIETSVNICDQANLEGVIKAAQPRGIGIIAKRPIANSAWKPLSTQPGLYADYAKTYAERFAKMGLSLEALGLEGEPARVWPEIALRFTLSQPGVHTAIVGTCHLEHAQANIDAVARGPLSTSARELIVAAFRKAEAASGKPWLGEM